MCYKYDTLRCFLLPRLSLTYFLKESNKKDRYQCGFGGTPERYRSVKWILLLQKVNVLSFKVFLISMIWDKDCQDVKGVLHVIGSQPNFQRSVARSNQLKATLGLQHGRKVSRWNALLQHDLCVASKTVWDRIREHGLATGTGYMDSRS